jgi:hypothetical protein
MGCLRAECSGCDRLFKLRLGLIMAPRPEWMLAPATLPFSAVIKLLRNMECQPVYKYVQVLIMLYLIWFDLCATLWKIMYENP